MSDTQQALPTASDLVRSYHARSKHRFEAYAEGPGQLDWDAQPASFRRFASAPALVLPLTAPDFERPFAELAEPQAAPAMPGLGALGALLQLSFGLSAWKSWGPSRWALRCNPSSGNLHPVEAYLLAAGVPGLADGVHHYDPEAHALEQRARVSPAGAPAWLAIGLSSIMWREAWKYGERAFRYCQLDVGHAIACLAYAAALLGWKVEPLGIAAAELGHSLGLDRGEDFPASRYAFTEAEEPEILLALSGPGLAPPPSLSGWLAEARWQGQASRIDPAPGYRWPVVDQVAAASAEADAAAAPQPATPAETRTAPDLASRASTPPAPQAVPPGESGTLPAAALPALPRHPTPAGAAALILQRRSGQRYDPRASLPKAAFYRLLDALLPRPQAPWQALRQPPRIHLALFVLRVDGLDPGLYLLPRSPGGADELAAVLQPAEQRFANRRPVADFDPDCPPHLGLVQLCTLGLQEMQRLARALSCHQDIAATGAFSLAMLGEFDAALAAGGHGYRQLLREAGLVGQALYLEAEAAGVRGTGIGCFFDDPVHQLFGLAGTAYQSVYHFTVGTPVADARIETGPPYPQRQQESA